MENNKMGSNADRLDPDGTAAKSPVRASRVLDPGLARRIADFRAANPAPRINPRSADVDFILRQAGHDPAMLSKKDRAKLAARVRYQRKRDARLKRSAQQAACKRLHSSRLRLARPPWADRVAMALVYAEAQRLTRTTGVPHEVDHEVPLLGKPVCGLHWEGNLRVVARSENRRKGNSHRPATP